MTKNDWYDAGDQIKKLVQDAVDSKDFSQLSSTIANVVNDAVSGLQEALKENLSQKSHETQSSGQAESSRDAYQYTNRAAAERIRRNIEERRRQAAERTNRHQTGARQGAGAYTAGTRREPVAVRVKLKVPGEVSGNVMKWTGYSVGGMFGLSCAILGTVWLGTGINMIIPGGIMAIFFAAGMAVGRKGSVRVKLAKRFRRYMEIIGDRTYCLVEELAAAVGKSDKYVQKDLKKMIDRGFFKQGYLARQETLLITDRTTYQQYLNTQTEYERREMERQTSAQAWKNDRENRYGEAGGGANAAGQNAAGRSAASGSADAAGQKAAGWSAANGNADAAGGNAADGAGKNGTPVNPRCREIAEEGQKYIRHIRECNDKIPGEAISAKLDRLELVITRIFREAEKNPDAADDLKKMMSYYLPTTAKLLDAYCEIDSQPIAGQNIENMKKEIEDALDTINTAFENLLDGFFEEKAWDISSDITVLNTMLAQEGLTGTDFSQKGGGIKDE